MSVYDRLAAAKTPRSAPYPGATPALPVPRRPSTSTAASRMSKRTYPTSPSPAPVVSAANTTGPKTSAARSRTQLRKTKSVSSAMRSGPGTQVPRSAPVLSQPFPSDGDTDTVSTMITNLAHSIRDADYVLIGAGAGFSADSGLAVYKDIARVPAYSLMGLDYSSLCDPVWLKRSRETFYGFWGHCFNTFRDTTPHQGYTIIRNMMAMYPGKAFFVYSSNVDSHFEKIGVPRRLIYEFHGTCMDWQCSRFCQADSVYRLPFHYRFNVNIQNMRCPANGMLYMPNPRSPPSLTVGATGPLTPSTLACAHLYASQYKDKDGQTPDGVEDESRPAAPTVSAETYSRIYSQDSRYRKSDNALHDALAKQGIDYMAIKSQARKACSASAALVGPSAVSFSITPIHATPAREELPPPEPTQLKIMKLKQDDAGKEILKVYEKHVASSIESAYKATYEAVRPLIAQNPGSHPTCPWCKSYLRPRVLMFNDDMFIENTQEECRYNAFKRKLLRSKAEKVCLLEIGCGLRIPTIRHELEGLLRSCTRRGIPCVMFRVNPETKRTRSVGHSTQAQLHHIPRGGKETLLKVAEILGVPY